MLSSQIRVFLDALLRLQKQLLNITREEKKALSDCQLDEISKITEAKFHLINEIYQLHSAFQKQIPENKKAMKLRNLIATTETDFSEQKTLYSRLDTIITLIQHITKQNHFSLNLISHNLNKISEMKKNLLNKKTVSYTPKGIHGQNNPAVSFLSKHI
jgi:hypothetical protein